jgi:hypothetical protein
VFQDELAGMRYPLRGCIPPELHKLPIWHYIEGGAIGFRPINIMNEGWLPRVVPTLCHGRYPCITMLVYMGIQLLWRFY